MRSVVVLIANCIFTILIIIVVSLDAHIVLKRVSTVEAKLDTLQSTADQTVDFLSDLYAEKEKAR